MSAKLIGLAALTNTFEGLVKAATSGDLHGKTIAAAKVAEKIIESEAPKGPTGNLKRSIESGGFKARTGKPVAAFVRVNRKIAPHAHLVEFGSARGQTPNPFFTRGFNRAKSQVIKMLEDGAGEVFDEALK